MDKTEFLRRVPLFSGLGEDDLQTLGRIAKVRKVARDESIFVKSSAGDSLYVVVDGRVKIFGMSESGKTKTFAYLDERDFFGEMGLMDAGTRSAGAKAVKDSTLLTVSREDFRALVRRNADFALRIIQTLSERLRIADREIESLSFNNVLGRVAGILLDLSDRYGVVTPEGKRIEMDFSHQDLADMAGTAREMVTRVLNRFRRTGCVAADGKRYVVKDPVKLRGWMA